MMRGHVTQWREGVPKTWRRGPLTAPDDAAMSFQGAAISRDDDSSPNTGRMSQRRGPKISAAVPETPSVTQEFPRDGYTIPGNRPAIQRDGPLIRGRKLE